jgi:diphthamide biosynthesis methyltransferase
VSGSTVGPDAARVTVVIPTLNRPQTCAAALRSALDQSGAVCDIVVSDNASDAVHAAAYGALFAAPPSSAQRRVRVLRRSERLSLEDHFSFLLTQVTTPWVVLLADDDTLAPTFVARALALAERSGAGWVFGAYASVDAAAGRSRTRSFDYSGASKLARAWRFVCRRDDAFIYGLARTDVMRAALAEFRPLRILGQRTLTRIAYAPLLVGLLAVPYAHLAGEPVWVRSEDSVKTESYLGENNVRKLVMLLLGEPVLAARFVRVAWQAGGAGLALALLPAAAVMAVAHCCGFLLQGVGRLARIARRRLA